VNVRGVSVLVAICTAATLLGVACGDSAIDPGADSGAGSDGGLDGGDRDGATGPDADAGDDSGMVRDSAVADDGLRPVLSGFRVENAHRDRVYFDSSEPITAATATGFVVSGRSAVGIYAEPISLTGHYLLVDAAFDYWDTTTVRYDGTGDVQDLEGNGLHEFSLQYVDNLLPEPEATDRLFFVDASASSSGDGRSEAEAFKTIQEGFDAIAGESTPEGTTLWIKAGDYGGESIDMTTSGTPDKPIKVIGYRDAPGDITAMYWTYGKTNPLVASEMPLLDGGSTVERAIQFNSDYVIYRNLQARDYYRTFVAEGSPEGVVVDNCLVNNTFRTHGNGIGFKGLTATRNRIINSTVVNASMLNFAMRGSYSLVENCRSYGDDRGNATDYYLDVKGSHHVIRENLLHRAEHNGHVGHGLSLKGRAIDNSETAVWVGEHTLIERCEVNNIRLAIHFGHKEVRYNVVRDITITGDAALSENGNGGILVLNSSHNLFERISVDIEGGYAIRLGATSEDRISEHGAHDNIIRNSIFRGGSVAVQVGSDGDSTQDRDTFGNQIENCTFVGHEYLESNPNGRVQSGNQLTNCIVDGTNRRTSVGGNPSSFTFRYTNFHENAFPEEAGEGNMSVDPQFVDASGGDLTPRNPALAAGLPLEGVAYDYDAHERDEVAPTVGASEVP